MNPIRRRRLFIVVFLVLGASSAVTVALMAMKANLNAYYPPKEIIDGTAPKGLRITAGGMVKQGSLKHLDGVGGSNPHGLQVSFVLTDLAGSEFTVAYDKILPDLFREGQGVLAKGELQPNGLFRADEVLAKHDENYMPPELKDLPRHAAADASAPTPAHP